MADGGLTADGTPSGGPLKHVPHYILGPQSLSWLLSHKPPPPKKVYTFSSFVADYSSPKSVKCTHSAKMLEGPSTAHLGAWTLWGGGGALGALPSLQKNTCCW